MVDVPLACDVLVVGGGINGAGIARDLAGRGVSVVLCEQGDLAQATSSASTKLIHGGLRYLEYGEFSLVRKALGEREVLLKSAPHIMWPLRFVMPHDPAMRPVWMIRLGLFLYDHLARRAVLPASATIDLRRHAAGKPLKSTFPQGFVYSDVWTDDARLVVLNALDAAERGATILTRWRCADACREATHWRIRLESACGRQHSLIARVLVNAAGPWAAQFLHQQAHGLQVRSLRLVKGSHIIVPKIFEHSQAYIFQSGDKRIIFAIPYERDFTLIGTTDVEYQGVPDKVNINVAETQYLCAQASRYFRKAVVPSDVVWSYSGVRPLLEDATGEASAVTRDYTLELNTDEAPLLNVWGGKLTTFRKLAEEAAALLAKPLGAVMRRGAWTREAFLPGGDFQSWIGPATRQPDADFTRFAQAVGRRYASLRPALVYRLARAYGSRIETLLKGVVSSADLGIEVVPDLFEVELNYLYEYEWARSAEDVLWRRSKLGLHLPAEDHTRVAVWCAVHWPTGFAQSIGSALHR